MFMGKLIFSITEDPPKKNNSLPMSLQILLFSTGTIQTCIYLASLSLSLYPTLPYPTPSHPIPSHPIQPIPSHPIPSHPIPSHPIPSHPIPSHPIPSHPIYLSIYLYKCTIIHRFSNQVGHTSNGDGYISGQNGFGAYNREGNNK